MLTFITRVVDDTIEIQYGLVLCPQMDVVVDMFHIRSTCYKYKVIASMRDLKKCIVTKNKNYF